LRSYKIVYAKELTITIA